MIRVVHIVGGSFPTGYRSDLLPDPWHQGVEREVAPGVAEYLTSTFPASFVTAKSASAPAPEPVLPGPFDAVIARPAADVVVAIESGAHDADLLAIFEAESASKKRKTVLAAIDTRIDRVTSKEA